MRSKFEFHCTECGKYFDFTLNTALSGNYRVHCPNCGHIHYRMLKCGAITETRFDRNDDGILVEDIRPMKSSCRDFQKEKEIDLASTAPGFVHRLWSEIFSARA